MQRCRVQQLHTVALLAAPTKQQALRTSPLSTEGSLQCKCRGITLSAAAHTVKWQPV